MKGLQAPDGAAPQATSPYLNCAPRSSAIVAAKYLELAAQERRVIEALEAEIAQRKIAERSYLARAAILIGGDDRDELKERAKEAGAAAPAAPIIPRLNIRCETTNGHAIGTTYLNVIRVEAEDDGSFTAVTDHWPDASTAPASEDLQADKRRLDGLRELCGYVENGSETSVTIFQDDATRGWIIRAGKHWWHGESLRAALDAALGDTRHD